MMKIRPAADLPAGAGGWAEFFKLNIHTGPPWRQLVSRRTSELACGREGAATVGIATGRRPISSAVRTVLLRQNANELIRDCSRMAIATADRNGRLSSTSTPAKM